MNTKKFIAKIIVAVALTIATIAGSGVAGEQMGVDITPSVYAGPCTSGSGGGC